MFYNKYSKKMTVLTIMVISTLVAGCNINNDDNGVTQQGTEMNRQRIQTNQQPDQQPDRNDVRIEVADKAVDKIVDIPGVRQANVLVTRRNAYVAAVLNDNKDRLNRKIEDQIAAQVRATEPDIQNVYVSTNPNFVDRINTYIDDVQQGRPVAGFVNEFNEMIQRIFPNAR